MKLEVRGVKVVLQSREILRDITFEVKDGDFVTILGPNGSGKSTLLRTIFGIVSPVDGVVLFDGKKLTLESKAKVMGFLPQETPEVGLKVMEVVLLGRTPHLTGLKRLKQEDIEVAKKALKEVGMAGFEERKFTELSGGERQKIMLARVFAQEPRLMLLDEPTAHLDLSAQLEIMNIVKWKVSRGCAAIVAMHDVNLAAAFAERVMMVKNGEIVYAGNIRDVLTPEAIKYVYGVDVVVRRHGSHVYVIPIQKRESGSGKVHIICGGGSGRDVIYMLCEYGYDVSVGVLNALDSDWEAAAEMGCRVVDEAPFCEISEDAHRRNLEEIERADVVVLANLSVGKGNLKNLIAAKRAAESGKLIVVESSPFKDRNFAGEVAERIYAEIRQKAIVVKSELEVLNAVRRVLDRG